MTPGAQYTITPDKFLKREERNKLLRIAKERAELDLLKGRKTWLKRYMLVDLALFSGLRVAEIAALKVKDVDLSSKDPNITVRNGKGNKKRVVYIDKELAKHLKHFFQLKVKTFWEGAEPESPLFTGQKDAHAQPITLMKSFKVALKEANLPMTYSIHSARHTYASFLLHDTKNLRYVQKQLGHSTIAMTALYADIMPEENGALANMISRD